jgi:hypothetical protein
MTKSKGKESSRSKNEGQKFQPNSQRKQAHQRVTNSLNSVEANNRTVNMIKSKKDNADRVEDERLRFQLQLNTLLQQDSGNEGGLPPNEDNWFMSNGKAIKSILLDDISYESVINYSGLLSGLYFAMAYALFYFSDVEGSILMENRNKSEYGLGISDGARFFGDTFKPFLSSYGIILTTLILLRIPFRLRRSDTASCYNAPNDQFMETLSISVKLMALYGSSFPVMLLVQDIAFAIAKK